MSPDLGDETHVEIAHYDTPRAVRSVQVRGNRAWISDLNWLRVLDVSDPARPRELASFSAPGDITRIQPVGDRVYFTASEAGLMVMAAESLN